LGGIAVPVIVWRTPSNGNEATLEGLEALNAQGIVGRKKTRKIRERSNAAGRNVKP
jgi:hypothetical protein